MRIVRKLAGVLLPLAAIVTVIPADAAYASNLTEGTFTFEGNANLPSFPCPLICNGSFGGSVSGSFAGDNNGNPWTLTLVQNFVRADFRYIDNLLFCGAGVVSSGLIVMSASAGSVLGTYGASPLPSPITDFSLTARFTWLRIGTAAHLMILNVHLWITVDPTGPPAPFGTAVIDSGSGTAVATFVPVPNPNNPPPDCVLGTSRPPITGLVAGSGVFFDLA